MYCEYWVYYLIYINKQNDGKQVNKYWTNIGVDSQKS